MLSKCHAASNEDALPEKSDEETPEELKKLRKVLMFTAGQYDRIRNRSNSKDRLIDGLERS